MKRFFSVILVSVLVLLSFSLNIFAEDETQAQTQAAETQQQAAETTEKSTASKTTSKTSAAKSTKSTDSSLSAITVVGKTADGQSVNVELSPEFSSATRTYAVTVPFEVVSLEIQAQATDTKASVNIPSGYLGLDVGANKSYIYVTAESGAKRTYLINTTRSEQAETTTAQTVSETTSAVVASTTVPASVVALDVPAPVSETSLKHRTLGISLCVVGAAFIIIAVILFVRKNRYSEGE